jgi:hypothetical protein
LSETCAVVTPLNFRIQAKEHKYDPKEGYVPNAEVALAIAEAVLPPVYGKERMAISPYTPRTCTPRSIST